MSWVVHKFGGTSVKDAAMFRRVKDIVDAEVRAAAAGDRVCVVVSAMSKVTDALFELCARAGAGDDVEAPLQALVKKHHDTIDALAGVVSTVDAAVLKARIEHDAEGLRHLLRATRVLRAKNDAIVDVVVGHGEVWSASILAAVLGFRFCDARNVLFVDRGDGGVDVNDAVSRENVAAFVGAAADNVVVTGYVAATKDGVPVTLGRNGSDFSASIFASLLDARSVVIWTDVDGVLSADPRRVDEAVVLDEMSYAEAMELAYFGAKVVHPRTMQPCVDRAIPIWIKNTFNPSARGTVIHKPSASASASSMLARTPSSAEVPERKLIKGFTTIDGIALLNLEGAAMVGVPGVAERLFGALRGARISVVVISQASSEHSISFAVPRPDAERAKAVAEDAFTGAGVVVTVDVDCSIIAAVGDGMAERAGVAGQFFTALGDVGVSVKAVAQGSSERNLTAVIAGKDSTRALRAVHARFTLAKTVLSVGVVGTGGIGSALLRQIDEQREELKQRFHVDVRVAAVASSKKMRVSGASNDVALDWDAFADAVRPAHLAHAVIVDCSAADDVADRYAGWLKRGIHVVTPNKKAASGSLSRWQEIAALSRKGPARYLGEATVGAGLPVISTLKELLLTGDDVVAVEGVLSGTLSWIFNTWQPGEAFSAKVREAKARGYTEPDAREDLSGLDFARKLVVLAREMGRDVSLDDVDIDDLAPGVAFGLSIDALVAALGDVDAALAQKQKEAQAAGRVLRMIGAVPESGRLRVSLQALPTSHPFARLDGTDNMLCFTTKRYAQRPLVVQGPGAGAEVTAGGVFGDLLRIAARLGGDV